MTGATEPPPLFGLTEDETIAVAGLVSFLLTAPICIWWGFAQLAVAYLFWSFRRMIVKGEVPWWYRLLGGI